jgi:uncharacterized protein YdeI (YjbR/CyaY-like superfamily)
MGRKDPRSDAYIAKSAEFAQPILNHLRDVVHAACPDVEETMKWSFPHFDYRGSMMCSMASFKAHCAFGFWKGALVLGDAATDGAMGQFGRITSLKELPSKKTLTGYIRKAMALNDEGVTVERRRSADAPEAATHPELEAALERSAPARRHFDAFPPGRRREYIMWINEAKTDATRTRRIEQAVEWIAEGKSRNWKYERK